MLTTSATRHAHRPAVRRRARDVSYSRRAALARLRRARGRGLSASAAAWLLVPAAGGWTDVTGSRLDALGLVPAVGMVVCSCRSPSRPGCSRSYDRIGCDASRPRRGVRSRCCSPARAQPSSAERWRCSRSRLSRQRRPGELATWWVASVVPAATVLTLPLVAVARSASGAARLRSAVPVRRATSSTTCPLDCRGRPWALCFGVAALAGTAALLAGGLDEGPRNAVAESLLVIACFAALGRRLGLRR